MGARRKGRILAFQSLYALEMSVLQTESRQPQPDNSLDFAWIDGSGGKKYNQESLDFGRLIAAGAIENLADIDRHIKAQLEHWDFSRINKVDQAILRMSVFGLLFQKEIPASVTIDEAVDIAKEYGTDESYRFINGVLDGIRKNLDR